MKSDEIKEEIENLVKRHNQIIEDERKIGQAKQALTMEIQKLVGKYEAYLEIEKGDSDGEKHK